LCVNKSALNRRAHFLNAQLLQGGGGRNWKGVLAVS
jgi:hypothetical protein